MSNFLLFGIAGAVSFGVVAGCSQAPAQGGSATKSPEEFLKWSMDQYKAMPAFAADATVTMTTGTVQAGPEGTRKIRYASPNRFSVISTNGNGFEMRSISDGQKQVEYSSGGGTQAASYPSPAGIADAGTMLMRHPMFCGTLLYQFFGGHENYDALVNSELGKVAFGDEMTGDGELAREVKFYGTQNYGHVRALIGMKTGRVYRIAYDSEPLLKMMKAQGANDEATKAMQAQIAKLKPGPDRDNLVKMVASQAKAPAITQFNSTEIYNHINTDASVAAAPFDVTLPKGIVAVDMPTAPSEDPPVRLGTPAPDIEVKDLNGAPTKLSSLKGHVVLLDFWATWCPPCRKGLPETAHVAKIGAASGVKVLAISGEDPDPVAKFLKQQAYALPVYLDTDNAAGHAYKADAIPTTAIIDAQGNLAAYFVGLQDASTIEKAMTKAGAKLPG